MGSTSFVSCSSGFLGLWTVSWWFLQSYSVFDIIVMNLLRTHRIKPNVFTMPTIYKQLAFTSGFSITPVVVALATDSVGFVGGPNPWCFIVDNKWLAWTFFYGPICLMVICSLSCMGIVIYTISKHLVSSQAQPSGNAAEASKRVLFYAFSSTTKGLSFS